MPAGGWQHTFHENAVQFLVQLFVEFLKGRVIAFLNASSMALVEISTRFPKRADAIFRSLIKLCIVRGLSPNNLAVSLTEAARSSVAPRVMVVMMKGD